MTLFTGRAALALLVPVVGLGAGAMVPAALAAQSAEAIIAALEEARFKAQVDRDLPALAAAIADDAIYIHANGIRQTKAEYLKDVAEGRSRYRAIETGERTVNVMGALAVTHALVTLHVGTDRTIVARTTGVYVRRGGKWLVLSWQSTPITAAAPAGPGAPAPKS